MRRPHARSAPASRACAASIGQHALGEAGSSNDVRASYGTYVTSTRRIWVPRVGSDACDGLADPPLNAQGFLELAEPLVRSRRIRERPAGGHAKEARRDRRTA